ncbi:MAG: hypothetical protein H6920_04300 [Sphingomonadaceae bacterium]|nr:hypothetical protein [Sphingomonadaceae bacterium]MCP5394590.1 hypothetical protein [Sphingomonadaceae bacterium]
MPQQTIVFEIEDNLTVDQNIATFVNKLKDLNPGLAQILSTALPDLSNDAAIDQGQLLDQLLAVISAPLDPAEQNGGGAS